MASYSFNSRPPYATDEPDSAYNNQLASQRRMRQKPDDPNARSSAYNTYDDYLNAGDDDRRASGIGGIGEGLMYMSDEEDEDSNSSPSRQQPTNIAAPRPGYPAPVAALNVKRPAPVAAPDSRKANIPQPLNISATMTPPPLYSSSPPHTPGTPGVPNAPHPLQAPLTPITPAFARPPKAEIKFDNEKKSIMRGNSEDLLIPKRGEKGDDFWRRFSMVVKEEQSTRYSRSSWLRKTQNGTSRLSATIWVIGIILLLCVAGAIGVGIYLSHKNTSTTDSTPLAVGGSAGETVISSGVVSTSAGLGASSTSLKGVSPTYTVDKRSYATGLPLKRHRHALRSNF